MDRHGRLCGKTHCQSRHRPEVDRSVCSVCISGQEEGDQKQHHRHGGHPALKKIELQAVKLENVTKSAKKLL
jgi:hypothetical protein